MAFFREKIFPALAGLVWLTFLALDLTGAGDSTWVKFAGICLCAAISWTGAGTADGRLVAVALTLTTCADWFLLVRNDHYILGVGIFIVVQLLYAYRSWRLKGEKAGSFGPLLALAALLAAGTLYPLFRQIRYIFPLLCIGVYFLLLCRNAWAAWGLKRTGDKGFLISRFAWGLTLFVCCDVCVGCWNLGILENFSRVGMWFFYLPSQVLITLSQDTKGEFDL